MNEETLGKPLEILIFEIGEQRHGLSSAYVQELLPIVAVTPLPEAPANVEGVMNLRGRVVPVLDVRARLRLPSRAPEPTDHLVVARVGERLVALRVDRATELLHLEATEVEDARHMAVGTVRAAWVAKLPDGLIPIHDLSSLISPADVAAIEEAVPAFSSSGSEG